MYAIDKASGGKIYIYIYIMKWATETSSRGILIKIGTDVQEILRVCLKILKSYNIGINHGKGYEASRWNGLRWRDIHTKFYGDRLRYLSNITITTATIWEAAKLVLLKKKFVEYTGEMD
jgi:hypothetical protein